MGRRPGHGEGAILEVHPQPLGPFRRNLGFPSILSKELKPMKRHVSLSSLLWSGLALVLALPALGAKVPAAVEAKKSQLPPLIDRNQFFGNPEIAAAQLSPDGKWIAFLKPFKETRNIWVKN